MSTPVDKLIFNETGCIRRELLLRYRDNELHGNEKHKVEEHLVDCNLCSDALEGLALIRNPSALDALQKEIPSLVNYTPMRHLRPWMAAATFAGLILFTYFTYKQFKQLNDDRLAVNETPVTETELKKPSVEPAIVLPDTVSPEITRSREPQTSEKKPERNDAKGAGTSPRAAELKDEQAMEESVAESQEASAKKMEIPIAASNEVAPVSTALKNTGDQHITYVDNVKVIDYNNYTVGNIQKADVPRSAPGKYQNDKKNSESTEAEIKSADVMTGKSDYLELVADPVILFNNGRYESANRGFDKLLKRNSNDQNAAFYKGLSLYNLNQYDPALELLVPLSNDSTSPFMEEAKFYAARSYIGNGEVDKGKKILESLANSNGFYRIKAGEELKKIK